MAHRPAARRIFAFDAMKNAIPFWLASWVFFYFFTLPYMAQVKAGFDRLDPEEVAAEQDRLKAESWLKYRAIHCRFPSWEEWARLGQLHPIDYKKCYSPEFGEQEEAAIRQKWEQENPTFVPVGEMPIAIEINPETLAQMRGEAAYTKTTATQHFFVSAALLALVLVGCFFPHKLSLFDWSGFARKAERFCMVNGWVFFFVCVGVAGFWWVYRREVGFYPLLVPAPVLLKVAPVYGLVLWEGFKETSLYRYFAIVDQGGDNARLGGVLTYIQRDLTGHFAKNDAGITREENSPFVLGKTWWRDDFKFKGRWVGLQSEQHLVTIAGTGAGKSRDMIFSNLLTYCGGVVGFDVKGEHVRVCKSRREKYAPFHVIDPYGIVSDVASGVIWNPLDEIDPDSDRARENIWHICEASIYKQAGEGGNEAHWRESCLIILRGFIAHVLTRCAPEDRHLGTVYDLICTGEVGGRFYNPKSFQNLLLEMMTNDAIQGSARDAAGKWLEADDRARAGYSSTLRRGIDWMNNKSLRGAVCGKSAFSMRDIKLQDATVFLVLPEDYVSDCIRFVRTFYTLAFDRMNHEITPQPKGSNRKVWYLMEESDKIGYMTTIKDALNIKRSSDLKLHFIYQNFGQIEANFSENMSNITAACDFQFFGLAQADKETRERLSEQLGAYTIYKRTPDGDTIENSKLLYTPAGIGEKLAADSGFQLILNAHHKHAIFLRRVPYFKIFSKSQYGERKKAVS